MSSATPGSLIRFDATTGILTACLILRAAQANPPRGTACAIVGMRASCQPIPCVQNRCARVLDRFRDRDRLVTRKSAFDEIERRNAVDDDEICWCRAAHRTHHRAREPHAVFERAAPIVAAMIRAQREELREQVSLRAHDFDTVIAGFGCEPCGRAKSSIVREMSAALISRGVAGLIGAFIAEGATMRW
jgi:hypothetical protein